MVDLRRSPKGSSFPDYAAAMREGVEQVVGGRYWVAGVHIGASFAVEVRRQTPERIAGMILSGLPLYNVIGPPPELANVAPAIATRPDGGHIDRIGEQIQEKWRGRGVGGAYHDAVSAFVQCFDRYAAVYDALFDYVPDLEAIAGPVLFVICDRDALAPHDVYAAGRIPTATVVHAPGVERDLAWSDPIWFGRIIRLFITSNSE